MFYPSFVTSSPRIREGALGAVEVVVERPKGWLMQYLNIRVSSLRSPAFVAAELAQRGAWLSITSYCIEQENGGRIPGCRRWTDRQTLQMCGVMMQDLASDCGLWSWDGDDLVVADYPLEQEQHWQAKRAAGRNGGSSTSEAKQQAVRENGRKGGRPRKSAAPVRSDHTGKTKAETKGNGTGREEEGNEKERNEMEDPSSPPAEFEGGEGLSSDLSVSGYEGRPQTDARFHAITDGCGATYLEALGMRYSFQGGKDGSALKRFLESNQDASVEDFLTTWDKALRRAKEDPFARHCSQAGTIHGFCTRWNDVRLELQRPAGGKSGNPGEGAGRRRVRDERGQYPGEIPTDVSVDDIRRL